jgi:response regulator RpfG family c-di-GMP phosphodiesterase
MTPAQQNQKTVDRSVLIVDDEPYVLSALSRSLLNLGFLLVTASDIPEAIRLLKSRSFQVVVSDFNMPQMQGPEFLEEVKKIQPKAIRVVLTGSPELTTVHRFMRKGQAIRYLFKPWNVEEIKATLQECFELYGEAGK